MFQKRKLVLIYIKLTFRKLSEINAISKKEYTGRIKQLNNEKKKIKKQIRKYRNEIKFIKSRDLFSFLMKYLVKYKKMRSRTEEVKTFIKNKERIWKRIK